MGMNRGGKGEKFGGTGEREDKNCRHIIKN